MSRDAAHAGARELAAAVRDGVVTSAQVVDGHLERVARHNPALKALVLVATDAARARAAEADAALDRGEHWGPLHGVPITVKDSFETAGILTTSSHPPLADHVPTRNATAVERLVRAGAIVMGKSNLPELERDVQSWGPLFGRAANPWDVTRTPGGSTGGGAAAVAAGLSPMELGSDTAGSVRVPAHYTGTFSLKPTEHRVSLAGKVPPRPGRPRGMRHLGVPGVIARSVGDLTLWLDVVEGVDARDPDAVPPPADDVPPTTRSPRAEGLRIAWVDAVPPISVGSATRSALERLADDLAADGATVERAAPDLDWEAALTTYAEVWGAECGLGLPRSVRVLAPFAARLTSRREVVARGVARGMRSTPSAYAATLTRRDEMIESFEAFLSGYDAWVLPVSSGPAFTHRRPGLLRSPPAIDVDGAPVSYDLATLGLTAPLSVLGAPVVTLPLTSVARSLPIGVQVVGRRWHDRRLLDVAERLVPSTGAFVPPPGYGNPAAALIAPGELPRLGHRPRTPR